MHIKITIANVELEITRDERGTRITADIKEQN